MIVTGLKKRIVVVDDHDFVEGVSFVLRFTKDYKVINSYNNAEDAISNIKSERPELILIEIDLPGIDGLSATKKIKEDWPNIDVIIISENIETQLILEAMSSGATGFLYKNDSFANDLVKFLNIVNDGGAALSPEIARKLVETYWKNTASPLSFRETAVLKLISEGNTYSEIGAQLNISKETSKSHIRNIYKKLNVSSRSQAVQRGMIEKLI